MSSSGYCSAEAQDFNIPWDSHPSCHCPTLFQLGPFQSVKNLLKNVGFFPQGYSRFFKKKEVTALAAVIFILQLTEPSSKEVSGILFKNFFFFPQKACASHTGGYVCCTDHPDPRHPCASINPPEHPQQAEGGHPAAAHPSCQLRGTGDRQSSTRRRHWL